MEDAVSERDVELLYETLGSGDAGARWRVAEEVVRLRSANAALGREQAELRRQADKLLAETGELARLSAQALSKVARRSGVFAARLKEAMSALRSVLATWDRYGPRGLTRTDGGATSIDRARAVLETLEERAQEKTGG